MKPFSILNYLRRHFPGVRDKDTLVSLARHNVGQGFNAQSQPRNTQSIRKTVAGKPETVVADRVDTLDNFLVAPIPDDPGMLDNADPLKASVRLTTPPRGLRRSIGIARNRLLNFYHFLRPPLTSEQVEEREQAKEYREFTALMQREAVRYASVISRRLAQLNLMNVVYTDDGKTKEHRVRFSAAAWDWNEETREGGRVIKLLVDTMSLPRGVRLGDLSNPITVNELLPTLHHPASVSMDLEGCIFTIQRGGVLGLPETVSITKMWDVMGENRSALTFCAGEFENSRIGWVDLAQCPHLLIAGASGQGKSNLINGILCTLIRNNPPETLRLVLFDMKEGVEFTFYEGLPHLYSIDNVPGIVDNPAKAEDAMAALKKEMLRRLNVIKGAGQKNIGAYNAHRYGRNRMPYLVVAFDEVATAVLLFGAHFERLLNEMTNQARAAGIHFIIGTQYPRADVLTTLVTINFSTRIAFSMSNGASMSVLGNPLAVGLPCPGRGILQRSGEDIQVQTPLISDSIIRATVKKAITGESSNAPLVAIEDVVRWSVEQANGELKYEQIFQTFRKRGLRYDEMKVMLMEADGKEFQVNGETYKVSPRFGRQPRRLERVTIETTERLDLPDEPSSPNFQEQEE